MASFDIAVGITQNGLNSTLAGLFANPTAQSKIFKQTFSEEIGGISVSVELVMQNTPTTVLAPPSDAKWQASYGADGTQQTGHPPAGNIFQALIPNLKVSGTVAGVSVSGSDNIEVYAEFTLVNKVLNVTALSVWVDESKWAKYGFTKLIVNGLIIPYALNTINNLLNAIPFPQIPTKYTSTTFQEPIMDLTNNNELVVATSMQSSPATNLDSYTPPASKDIYLQAGLSIINTLLAEQVAKIPKPWKASDSKGDSLAKASAEIQATFNSITGKIQNGQTAASINITDISGYGELSGVGTAIAKTVLCPIGTAIDAISNPSTWDKVISSFSIQYRPDPLDIPFSVNVTAEESVQVSIGQIDSVQIIAAPKWSGVIGSTLAAAAAGFVDLLSAIFKEKIVNAITKQFAQNIEVWKDATVTKQIEGINIKLSATPGAALVPQGNSLIVEGFNVSFPV
ncbi:hypothetical protein FAM09_16795 [Niastella caeni]|uniref:Uncharacterized protein n=1 Tax=Niastella caeni TaxID=2569763 RepID=A0A4S8HS83_9BACT|nr:hypothetical protein [Niastella caeni]THU38333.1 hypothetical protein FAM09_16795 [Niastella caeni]